MSRPHSTPLRVVNALLALAVVIGAMGMQVWPVERVEAAELTPVFQWKMIDRHFSHSLVDPNNLEVARGYVHPDVYGVSFDGCDSLISGEGAVTHMYTITGDNLAEPLVIVKRALPRRVPLPLGGGFEPVRCSDLEARTELPLGTYTVTLHVFEFDGLTGEEYAGTSAPVTMTLRDILIISVGDSYASGEGAPDRFVQFGPFGYEEIPAAWQDQRCHRSTWAGPARGALILEQADPHTSVTFVSLACSGATINTPIHDPGYKGAGLLRHYAGIEPKEDFPSPGTFIPAQMEQAAYIAEGRAIDALLVSGGGNDMHFAKVIADCVVGSCDTNEEVHERIATDFQQLPIRYQELANFINSDPNSRRHLGIPDLNVTPDRVFITEYPDPTRNSDGDWCEVSPLDDPLLAFPFVGITKAEMAWAHYEVVTPINQAIKRAADDHGWNYVGGIAAEFFGSIAHGRKPHGWCAMGVDENGAPNNWINRSTQSLAAQGPVGLIPLGLIAFSAPYGPIIAAGDEWPPALSVIAFGAMIVLLKNTDGTMHPNRMGQMVYARHIAAAVQARLDGAPTTPGGGEAPVIDQPSDVTVSTGDPGGRRVVYPIPQARDAEDGVWQATCSPPPGSVFPVGMSIVTCFATDSDGNHAIPVTFHVTVERVVLDLPMPADGYVELRGWCQVDESDRFDSFEEPGLRSVDTGRMRASVNGSTIKAVAAAEGDSCRLEAGYSDVVTVEAGESGLQAGDPVQVQVTVLLDGAFTLAPGSGGAEATLSTWLRVNRVDCTPGRFSGGCYPPITLEHLSSVLALTGPGGMTWSAEDSWRLREGEGQTGGGLVTDGCNADCGDSLTLPYEITPLTIRFDSFVGEQLNVTSIITLSASSDAGGFAKADFGDTFVVSAIHGAPGFEGLSFSYESSAVPVNQAPSVDAGGSHEVDEGGSVTLTATGDDPDGDDLSYAWDLDGDGAFETDGQAVSFSAADIDGPATVTVTVRATDPEGLEAVDEAVVEVRNVGPDASIDTAPATVAEGTPVHLTGTGSDPAPADALEYAWEVTKNGDLYASGSGQGISFTPDDDGDYLVTLTVTDDDGGAGQASVSIVGTNVAPVVDAGEDGAIRRGETFTRNGSFSDPGADTWTATVDYGDGAGARALDLNADGTFDLAQTFIFPGAFTVAVCVTDDDGGTRCDDVAVTVTPYAIFAGSEDCEAVTLSGNGTRVKGDAHTNGGLKVSGANSSVNGETTYRCAAKVTGRGHAFTSGPTRVDEQRPAPAPLTRASFACDIEVAGTLDLSGDGAWWAGGKATSRQLESLTICADEITLGASNVSGTVTLVAGKVTIGGSNLNLTAREHGVVALATGTGPDALTVSGSKGVFSGDLIAPAGGIKVSGAGATVNGGLLGWTVSVSGSNVAVGE